MSSIGLEGLDHVALLVRDQARSIAWYRDILGLEQIYEAEWGGVPAVLVAPGTRTGVALFAAENPQAGGVPSGAIAVAHVAFRIDGRGFEGAQAALADRGVPFRFEDHAVSHSIYFSDPDGHRIEITTYDV